MKAKQVLDVKNFNPSVKKLSYEQFFNMFQATYDRDELERIGRELELKGAPAEPVAPEEVETDDLTGEKKTEKPGKKGDKK